MLEIGAKVGRYEITGVLGQGGMGQVFLGRDPELRRDVAIKVLREDAMLPDARERFLREARATAALHHPNVVTIFDVGVHEGAPYMVMELLSGTSLRASLKVGVPSLRTRVGWLIDVAKALSAAHHAGLVHRDVKPDNVIVTDAGAVKVLDFGLAKPPAPRPGFTFDTQDERTLGTPRYMAPEQLIGGPADAKADQYAWGRTAFELITGSLPPQPKELPRLDTVMPSIPKGLADIIERTQAPLASARFEHMNAVESALAIVSAELVGADETPTKRGPVVVELAETRREPPRAPLQKKVGRPRRSLWIFAAAVAPGVVFGVLGIALLAQPIAKDTGAPPSPTASHMAGDAAHAEDSSAMPVVEGARDADVTTNEASSPPPPAPATSCFCRERRLGRVYGPLCTSAQKAVCRCSGKPASQAAAVDLCLQSVDDDNVCTRDPRKESGVPGAPCVGVFRASRQGGNAAPLERVTGTFVCSLCNAPPARESGKAPSTPCKGYAKGGAELVEGVWDCAP